MADDRGARKGGGRKGGDDDNADPLRRQVGRGKALLNAVLDISPTDTFGEVLADSAVNKQADKLGVRFAEHFLKMPAARALLLVAPASILEYVGPAAANFVAMKWTDHERPRAWSSEFAEGFTRRLREEQDGKGVTGPAAPAAGTAPAAPAGPREMSPSEVLNKHPEIGALLDSGLRSLDPTERQLAAEVQADIHQHLNYAHEGVTLSATPLPPPPFDTDLAGNNARLEVVKFVETNCEATKRPAAYEELRKRITRDGQLTGLLAPLPAVAAPAVPAVAFTQIAAQVDWLRVEYADPDDFTDTLRRLAPHAGHADRMVYLFSAPADAGGLPAVVAASVTWSTFTATAVTVAPGEAAALIAEAESRVATVTQAQGLIAPPAGGAPLTLAVIKQRVLSLPKRTVALTKPIFEGRLTTLERMHPAATASVPALTWDDFWARLMAIPERKGELTLDLLKQRMQLIKDAGASRSVAAFAGRTGKMLSQLGADIAGTVTGDITNGIRNLKI
ncbi:hypothetical protein EPO33_04100 [Patescibacteria group bacterium]|nr:MAG: hypothetical protein EPO33_04100 [Patescibacteria group bacterium]